MSVLYSWSRYIITSMHQSGDVQRDRLDTLDIDSRKFDAHDHPAAFANRESRKTSHNYRNAYSIENFEIGEWHFAALRATLANHEVGVQAGRLRHNDNLVGEQ